MIPVQQMIPTKIFSSSCVAYPSSRFPRGYGNYISVKSNTLNYIVVNVSNEDLTDAKDLGLVDKIMLAEVYEQEGTTDLIAYIIDENIPEKARKCEYWYGVPTDIKTAILRKKYNLKEDICLCERSESFYSSVFFHMQERGKKVGKCCQCKSTYTITRVKPDENQRT